MGREWFPQLRPALRQRFGETKGLAARSRSSAVNYTVSGTPYAQNWSTHRAVREGFQANPWVYRACEVIAHTGVKRRMVLVEGDDPDDENARRVPMRSDPTRLLFTFNRRANPWETARMLRYRLYVLWLLSSRGVPLEIARSRAGRIATATILDPDLVEIIPSPTNPIETFEIRTTGDTGGRRDYLPPFDPETDPGDVPNSVLWLRSPHPSVLTQGMSPMEAAGLSVDLDRYARLYNRDYMQQGGRPGGILGVRGSVDPDTVLRLQDRFNRDARPGYTTAIQADAMFYQDLSTSPRDMQWGEVMDRMRKEASMVFGVPESLMGDASGRTFDNADAEHAIYLEHRFGGLIGMVDDQLDILTGGYADDLWLRHDMSDIWVLKRHRRAEEDRWAADLERGAITFNDYRDKRGLPPIDAPWARVHWVTPGKLAGYATDEGDAAAAAAAPMGGQPAAPDPAAAAREGAAEGAAIGAGIAETNANATRLRLVAGEQQGRDIGADDGGLMFASARTAGLEGKQRRARHPDPATTPRWR